VSELIPKLLDATRLLLDLQQANDIAQTLSGCLSPEEIAQRVTDGLVERFDCTFARIWLVEPDRTVLRLVSSSGLYTHTNGSFARVPMGAFKVGKIAQNCIPFLSNRLPDEAWVKDRDWAIANHIVGFAGYPLALQDRVLGVIAVFSRRPMSAEFIEVLQTLCTIVAIALENVLHYQELANNTPHVQRHPISLAEQLNAVLPSTRLILVGTEKPLPLSLTLLLIRTVEVIQHMDCRYCRLTYHPDSVTLEAVANLDKATNLASRSLTTSALDDISLSVTCIGGTLKTTTAQEPSILQLILTLPCHAPNYPLRVRIKCRHDILQLTWMQMAYRAGIGIEHTANPTIPLLTDDLAQVEGGADQSILWVDSPDQSRPAKMNARLTLATTPQELLDAVTAVSQGHTWGLEDLPPENGLSNREQDILGLLAQGLRDRDIAQQLFISERTVKFHVNNVLTKLNARTRFQAIYQAMLKGWLKP
jgi:DNA-binding CsgD family transcriptional regulator